MELRINGEIHAVDVETDTPPLWVLRDTLGMTGTKYGCGQAQCGACTVLVDGVATRSCVTTIDSLEGASIVTIEDIETDPVGAKVVAAWIEGSVPQCGYCQSGQVGEPAVAVTAPAVVNAASHLLGRRLRSLPLSQIDLGEG